MITDSVGNFFTSIRNGLMVKKRSITSPFSELKSAVAKVLLDEGYIRDFQKVEVEGKPYLKVVLKYVDGESVVRSIVRVSRPGLRHYGKANALEPVIGGLGIAILTTSAGVLSDRDARRRRIGGEVLCRVW